MPISYPSSAGASVNVTTTANKIAPSSFAATINTTFPINITGTSPTEVGTFFLPYDFLYGLSGSAYYVTVVGFVTGATNATASVVLAKNVLDIPVDLTYHAPAGPTPFYSVYKGYDPGAGNIDFVYTFGLNPGDSGYFPALSAPIEISCSAANVSCSILSINFSYSGSV